MSDCPLMSAKDLLEQINQVEEKGRQVAERFIDFGSPEWNKATESFEYGVFFICGAPNMGKSAIVTSKMLDVLENNNDVAVIDFTLDDTIEKRLHRLVSNRAGTRINQIAIAHDLSEDVAERRLQAYREVSDYAANDRYAMCEIGVLSTIEQQVAEYRARLGDDVKIVMVLDGVHNVKTQSAYVDPLSRQEEIVARIGALAKRERAAVLSTAHVVKSRGVRSVSMDDLKGSGYSTFEANIISMVYCDIKVNRAEAQVFRIQEMPDEETGELVPTKCPVIELNIVKDKSSEFNDVIFHDFWPEQARTVEVSREMQVAYRNRIYRG